MNVIIGSLLLLMISSPLIAQDEQILIDVDGNGKMLVPKSLMTEITVQFNKVPFGDVLSILEEKGNFQLNYNNDRLPLRKLVTINMKNVPALDALRKILKDTGTAMTVTKDGQIAIIPGKSGSIPRTGIRSVSARLSGTGVGPRGA